MSSEHVPVGRTIPIGATNASASSVSIEASSSLWSRISSYVAEHKAVVYTVGAVVIVATGAGVVYYISENKKSGDTPAGEKRKSKKERRKEKEKEKAKKEAESKGKEKATGT